MWPQRVEHELEAFGRHGVVLDYDSGAQAQGYCRWESSVSWSTLPGSKWASVGESQCEVASRRQRVLENRRLSAEGS